MRGHGLRGSPGRLRECGLPAFRLDELAATGTPAGANIPEHVRTYRFFPKLMKFCRGAVAIFSRKPKPKPVPRVDANERLFQVTWHIADCYTSARCPVSLGPIKYLDQRLLEDDRASGDVYVQGFVAGVCTVLRRDDPVIRDLSEHDFATFCTRLFVKLFGEETAEVAVLNPQTSSNPEYKSGVRDGLAEGLALVTAGKSTLLLDHLKRRAEEWRAQAT